MQRLGSRQGQPRMSTFLGKATAAVIFTAALCQSGVANAGAHSGGGGGFGGGFPWGRIWRVPRRRFSWGRVSRRRFPMAVVFAATGSMTVDLEGFAVDLACWDGLLRVSIRIGLLSGLRLRLGPIRQLILGITAPIPPVITLM